MRLGPRVGDINAPYKPSYGDNTYDDEDETTQGATYNGSDLGSLTFRNNNDNGLCRSTRCVCPRVSGRQGWL